MRNGIGGFLETLSLEIDAEASVRNDEIRIHWALDAARLFAEGSKSISAMTHFKINKNRWSSQDETHVLHLRGRAYPCSPGGRGMLLMTDLQPRH